MRRLGICVLALGLLAPTTWSDAPFKKQKLEADLALTLVLKTKGPIEAGTPLLADLRITNQSKDRTYPVVMPQSGCQQGVTEPYVWFTARLKPVGSSDFEPIDPARSPGMCGMGDWSWHRHVRTVKPGASLDVQNRLHALDFDLAEPGTLELTAHYGFLTKREQPRLPGAEGPGDLGPMTGVPAFELRSKPVTIEVVRTLYVRVEKGTARLRPGKPVRLSDVLRATFANTSGSAVTLRKDQYAVWVEFRTGAGKPFADVERKPVGALERPARSLITGASAELLGPKGWYDERLEATKRPQSGIEARVVLRIESSTLLTLRSRWLRVD